MARDYAQRGGNRRQASNTRKPAGGGGGMPGWVWLVAGLSVGLAIAAFVYIQRPTGTLAGSRGAAAVIEPAQSAPARTTSKAIPLPPKEKDRFTFYEILRNQEVIIPRESVRDAKPPAPASTDTAAAGGGSYLIQTASFRAQAEAERHKANLALLGVESRIESVTIDNKDTFYRVRIGPLNEWSRVQSTMARLEENGIQGMVVKLR